MHKVRSVMPCPGMVLSVVFQDGTEKIYNMRQLYGVFPQFKSLEELPDLFNQVRVDAGGYGISWNDELDLACDELWDSGIER